MVFKSELNTIINLINRRQQIKKVSIGNKKNESIYISIPVRKHVYNEDSFFKILHINITEQKRELISHSKALNLGIKNISATKPVYLTHKWTKFRISSISVEEY